jgi:hypothetical protein
MTDSEVGCKTFEAVLHRKPDRKEFARLLERRLYYLHQTFAESEHYGVLPGVEELLPKLIDDGHLLGLVTGNLEVAAHIKLHSAQLNRFFSFGGDGSDSTDRGELTRIAIKRAPQLLSASPTASYSGNCVYTVNRTVPTLKASPALRYRYEDRLMDRGWFVRGCRYGRCLRVLGLLWESAVRAGRDASWAVGPLT